MKRLIINQLYLLIFTYFLFYPFLGKSQETPKKEKNKEHDTLELNLGDTKFLIIKQPKDSLRNKNKEEKERNMCEDEIGGTSFFLMDLGLNSYRTNDGSSLPSSYKYLDVNLIRSRCFNMIFIQQAINLYSQKLFFIAGIGLDFNNYVFDKNTRLYRNPDSLEGYYFDTLDFDKSKLATSFWTLPVGFHIKSNPQKEKHSFIFEAGVKLAYMSGAHTKIVYHDANDKRQLNKEDDDWHLEKFRYGPFFRIGYGHFKLFFNYSLSPLFKKGEGKVPELFPYSAGITLNGF